MCSRTSRSRASRPSRRGRAGRRAGRAPRSGLRCQASPGPAPERARRRPARSSPAVRGGAASTLVRLALEADDREAAALVAAQRAGSAGRAARRVRAARRASASDRRVSSSSESRATSGDASACSITRNASHALRERAERPALVAAHRRAAGARAAWPRRSRRARPPSRPAARAAPARRPTPGNGVRHAARRPASRSAAPSHELVDAAVAGRGLAGGARGHPAADGRELERLREVAERQALGGQPPLGARPEQARPRSVAVSDVRSTSSRRSSRRRSSEITPRSRPRSGSTPPTTLVPPPNGTTATRVLGAGREHGRAPRRPTRGHDHGVGRARRVARSAGARGPGSCAPRRGRRAPRGRRARAPRRPLPPAARAAPPAAAARAGAPARARPCGVPAAGSTPELVAQQRHRGLGDSARRAPSSPQPHQRIRPSPEHACASPSSGLRRACRLRRRRATGTARSAPSRAASGSSASSHRACRRSPRRLERDLGDRLDEDALERRLLELLAPDEPRSGSAPPRACSRRARPCPCGDASTVVQASRRGLLDARHARPPARQVSRVAHHAPDLVRAAAVTDAFTAGTITPSSYDHEAVDVVVARAARGRRGTPARSRSAQPATTPPACSTSSQSARGGAAGGEQVVVHQHARAARGRASACTSSASTPYSSSYSTETTSRGSLPGLRARMKPAPAAAATRRAEHEAARLGRHHVVDLARARRSRPAASTASRSASASRNSGVMSLKTIPGLGKSGMSWM